MAFGLVNVPVKMYTATRDHDIRFHQVHEADGGRIRMKRVCQSCDREVPYPEIAKGYQDSAGRQVMVDADEMASLPVADDSRVMEVVQFVPNEQIDPILFDRTYYLEPEERTVKPYVLLREALRETERTAVVRVAIRRRTQLACLRIRDDVMMLQTLKWPDEIRSADFEFTDRDLQVRPQELAMAESLIDSMTGDFVQGDYQDEYRDAILQLLDKKLAGVELPAPQESSAPQATGEVVDLMAALRASVERSRSASSGDSDESARDESGKSDESGESGESGKESDDAPTSRSA